MPDILKGCGYLPPQFPGELCWPMGYSLTCSPCLCGLGKAKKNPNSVLLLRQKSRKEESHTLIRHVLTPMQVAEKQEVV